MGRDDKRDRRPGGAPSASPPATTGRPSDPPQAATRDGDDAPTSATPADAADAAPEANWAGRSGADRTAAIRGGAAPGSPGEVRWFDLHPEAAARPLVEMPPRRPVGAAALGLAAAALLLVALGRGLALRAALPLTLALSAIALLWRGRARTAPEPGPIATPPAASSPRRALSVSPTGIAFHGAAEAPLFAAAPPFGLTLVTSRTRDRLVAAVTSSQGAFYVGCAVPPSIRDASAALLARASILGSEEVGLEAIGPDGEPVELSAGDLVALIDDLVRADASCLDRCILSDARGAPVVLDGTALRARDLDFDLTAPIEWRALLFQEPFGQSVAVYQATWLRQGTSQAVLVSLLPSIEPSAWKPDAVTGIPELDRAALRDLRLGQASPEAPPPTEIRVAVDRLFMLPLRAALDRAPHSRSGRARP